MLSLCHDQVILNAVHSIIQNMIACEDVSQQQLSYLQSKPAGRPSGRTVVALCACGVVLVSCMRGTVPRRRNSARVCFIGSRFRCAFRLRVTDVFRFVSSFVVCIFCDGRRCGCSQSTEPYLYNVAQKNRPTSGSEKDATVFSPVALPRVD